VLFVASDITQSLSLSLILNLTLTLTLTSTLITITNWWRNLLCKFFYPRKYPKWATRSGRFPPWSGIFFKLARCGYTLRVTSQASYSPEYITPTQKNQVTNKF
jgi:hypothetical protein